MPTRVAPRRRQYLKVLPPLCAALLSLKSLAAAFPSEPIPRVETGLHAADIKNLAICQRGAALLSVSEDKTARLWSSDRTGSLLATLRVPIDSGDIGQLFAGTCTADGRWLAIGGYTVPSASGAYDFQVLVMDGAKPDAQRAHWLGPFLTAPLRMRFSPDGHWLAVATHESRFVYVLDWNARISQKPLETS
jgi:WD40 repeat protein